MNRDLIEFYEEERNRIQKEIKTRKQRLKNAISKGGNKHRR